MSQHHFTQALLDPALPVPAGLIGPDGRPAQRRFDVYRNNVTLSLLKALETGFPVVRRLVGEEFFTAMAREFLRAHPPQHPILMLYGAEFPAFLQGFAPVAHLGYLPDVARLEQAIRESYHSADAAPLPPEALGELLSSDLLSARLTLAPALRVVDSDWPIHDIWVANTTGGVNPRPGPQSVAILRPVFDPEPQLLPLGGGAVLMALKAGEPLGAVLAAAPADFDLTTLFSILINGKALVGASA